MILEKMIFGEVREVHCHCPACTLPIVIEVRQNFGSEIEIKVYESSKGKTFNLRGRFGIFARKGAK